MATISRSLGQIWVQWIPNRTFWCVLVAYQARLVSPWVCWLDYVSPKYKPWLNQFNSPDMPPTRTKKVRLGIYCTQIWPSEYDTVVISTMTENWAYNQLKVCIQAKWPIRPEPIPVSVAWSDYECFYSSLDGMLVHRRFNSSMKFAGTHLYSWVSLSE